MHHAIGLFLGALLLSLALTPLFQRLLERLGVIDCPDGDRRLHHRPIPRGGGIPLAISFALPLAFLYLWPQPAARSALIALIALAPAGILIFLCGVIDDVYGVKPWYKLAVQVLASLLACGAGFRILGVNGHGLEGWWTVPVTVVWLVGATNAVNLIDGIDGLAAGVGLCASATMLLAGVLHGNHALVFATAPLAGALLGFLRYNASPARIFLGDSGSLLIGFLLGCYGVLWSHKTATLLGMTAPLMLMALPLIDTGLTIARRYLRGKPIFAADRGHLHHRLLDSGFSPRRAVVILYGLCGLAAVFSLWQSVAERQVAGLVIAAFAVCCSGAVWFGITRLRYVEIDLAGRLFWSGRFNRRTFNIHLYLNELAQRLSDAPTVFVCWTAIREAARDLGFCWVTLRLAGESYDEEFVPCNRDEICRVGLPLSGSGYIEFGRDLQAMRTNWVLAPVVEMLQELMQSKLDELQLAAAFSANGGDD